MSYILVKPLNRLISLEYKLMLTVFPCILKFEVFFDFSSSQSLESKFKTIKPQSCKTCVNVFVVN